MSTHEHEHDHEHGDHDGHEHDGHEHEGMLEDVELSERARRVLAMEELLTEKGVINRDDVRRLIDVTEARSPVDGARVVARAWVDPAYRRRLLEEPEEALAELGYPLVGSAKLAVLENTETLHHLVVCTLCSLLPDLAAGASAGLVQELRVPVAGRGGPARRHGRVRPCRGR